MVVQISVKSIVCVDHLGPSSELLREIMLVTSGKNKVTPTLVVKYIYRQTSVSLDNTGGIRLLQFNSQMRYFDKRNRQETVINLC